MIHLTMQARWASECYFKDHTNYVVVDMCKKKKKKNEWNNSVDKKPKSSENVWIVSSSCTIYWFNDYKLNHSKRAHFLHHTDDLAIGCRTNLTSWKFFPQWAFGSQPSAVIACVLNKNAVSWQTRNNRQLPKHKLSQNAKNLQCLLKFRLIEDNVTVFQWLWNSESG